MNLLFITKYPPLEGGTASRAYWLINGLAEKGHRIFVVTNAQEALPKDKAVVSSEDSRLNAPGVTVFNIDSKTIPPFIPYSKQDVALLVNKALQITRFNKIDIICSWYLLPYGLAGMLVGKLTGIPHLVKHAGSDLARLLQAESLKTVLFEVLSSADLIMTTKEREEGFLKSGFTKKKIFLDSNHTCCDHTSFNPQVSPKKFFNNRFPVVAYFGKLEKAKGVLELAKALSQIKDRFNFLIVSGSKSDDLSALLGKIKKPNQVHHIPFVPPWQMPQIIKACDLVVVPERKFSVKKHVSVLINEVMALGKCLLLSTESYSNNRRISNLEQNKNVLTTNILDRSSFKKALTKALTDQNLRTTIGQEALKTESKSRKYQSYLDNFILAAELTRKSQ